MATAGFKLSLASAKAKPGRKAPPANPAKKRRLALEDEHVEDSTAKQAITGWDAAEGGAVAANGTREAPAPPRVIPALPNRDWREEVRKKQLARPAAAAQPAQNGDTVEKLEQPKVAFGLTTFTKKEGEEEGAKEADQPEPMDTREDDNENDNLTDEQRLQAQALDALVNGKATTGTVIPLSEAEALHNELRDAPPAPTLEAYEATPIEGFGAALLRGMGWKDGESLGKDKKPVEKPRKIERRPALLGIGAKPEAALGIELGEWGQKKGGKKAAMSYNPVVLRNKVTGETITEEELQKRLETQKLLDEKPARSSSSKHEGKDDDDDERRRKRKDRERRDDEYDRERRRDKDRRRDRDEDRDHRRERETKYRDDDSDRRREKRREKERRDRERSRSPYDDERRDKRRERDRRERSMDSEDRRREKRRERERRGRDRSRSRDEDDRSRRRGHREYEEGKDGKRRDRDRDDKSYRK